MMRLFLQCIGLFFWCTFLTGGVYPLLLLGIGNVTFYEKTHGSLVYRDDRIVGSYLIGQSFREKRYFWSRPSSVNYDPSSSGASNLGPTSAMLKTNIKARQETFGTNAPIEFLTASGSGLDPHISLQGAIIQIPRIVRARNLDRQKEEMLRNLVQSKVEAPDFGFLGEERVNVFKLNLALDQLFLGN
ncbi:MAG TPA: potassium-transporting ATPase subunit KdpC [Oligoflexia bacterium]|nr:potassium-transporting ATPase subunit KdpC [Oligoflexia bacterium]HMR24317.1 potassium-transporting ATPase subunit KdpC [Oligoflexia bacterium]